MSLHSGHADLVLPEIVVGEFLLHRLRRRLQVLFEEGGSKVVEACCGGIHGVCIVAFDRRVLDAAPTSASAIIIVYILVQVGDWVV